FSTGSLRWRKQEVSRERRRLHSTRSLIRRRPQNGDPGLAPLVLLRHIRAMSGRPCKHGSDLHGLWRLLLPGTAFPACGGAEKADKSEQVALVENARDDKADAGEPQR